MKNIIVVLILTALFVTSCGKDKEEPSNTNSLIGTWEESTSKSIRGGFVFNADMTGNYYDYRNGIKTTPVYFNYIFSDKTMVLTINWIATPQWTNPTDLIEIKNGVVLYYKTETYYKK